MSKYLAEEEKGIIALAKNGDSAAFESLYQRYNGQIFAFCMRILKGKYDVEDAVQQTFFEAWRSIYRFEHRSLFSTWLTKIAIHTCLSIHRKLGRVTLLEGENNTGDHFERIMWANAPCSPHDKLQQKIQGQAVSKILSRMTPKKQKVFILSDLHGMTAPEISKVLGIPDATVRTRLFHARKEFTQSVQRNPTYRVLLTNEIAPLRKKI